MEKLRSLLIEYKDICLKYKKEFLGLLVIYLLAFSAIIRANYTYADDIGRTFEGYHGWLDWSRYGTELLATLMHANWELTDISPFPQILACIIMAACGVVLLNVFKEEQKITVWNILAVSITAVGPYFLGLISYKFDSPYMAVAFLASVLPFLFRKFPVKVYVIVSVLCLLVMCTTYQAYSGVYPMVVCLLVMQGLRKGEKFKDGLKFLGISAGCYVASLCVFWLFLMRENGVSVFSLSNIVTDTMNRYVGYYQTVYSDFAVTWLLLTAALLICFLVVFTGTDKIKKSIALLLGVLTILINSVLCFGAYLFISREAFDTRAMCGWNVYLGLFAVFISFQAKTCIPKFVYSVLAWCFFGFALTHGNALAQEQTYIDYRVQLIVNDLNDLDVMQNDKAKKLHVEGYIGNAPVNENMAKTYPILKRTIYSPFNEGALGEYYLCNYINLPNVEAGSDEEMSSSLPVVKDTAFYTIKADEENIIITMK